MIQQLTPAGHLTLRVFIGAVVLVVAAQSSATCIPMFIPPQDVALCQQRLADYRTDFDRRLQEASARAELEARTEECDSRSRAARDCADRRFERDDAVARFERCQEALVSLLAATSTKSCLASR